MVSLSYSLAASELAQGTAFGITGKPSIFNSLQLKQLIGIPNLSHGEVQVLVVCLCHGVLLGRDSDVDKAFVETSCPVAFVRSDHQAVNGVFANGQRWKCLVYM